MVVTKVILSQTFLNCYITIDYETDFIQVIHSTVTKFYTCTV